MADPLRIEIPADSFMEAVGVVRDTARKVTVGTMNLMAGQHELRVKQSFGRPGRLKSRSSLLKNSIRSSPARETQGRPEASVFVAGPTYGQIQEQGGVVRPKRGRYLTIPLSGAKTKGGDVRAAAKLVKRGDQWETAQRVPGAANRETWIRRKSASSRPVIFVEGKNGRPIPLYVLARSAKIPARFGFVRDWDDAAAKRERQWQQALDAVGRAFKRGQA